MHRVVILVEEMRDLFRARVRAKVRDRVRVRDRVANYVEEMRDRVGDP